MKRENEIWRLKKRGKILGKGGCKGYSKMREGVRMQSGSASADRLRPRSRFFFLSSTGMFTVLCRVNLAKRSAWELLKAGRNAKKNSAKGLGFGFLKEQKK